MIEPYYNIVKYIDQDYMIVGNIRIKHMLTN